MIVSRNVCHMPQYWLASCCRRHIRSRLAGAVGIVDRYLLPVGVGRDSTSTISNGLTWMWKMCGSPCAVSSQSSVVLTSRVKFTDVGIVRIVIDREATGKLTRSEVQPSAPGVPAPVARGFRTAPTAAGRRHAGRCGRGPAASDWHRTAPCRLGLQIPGYGLATAHMDVGQQLRRRWSLPAAIAIGDALAFGAAWLSRQ